MNHLELIYFVVFSIITLFCQFLSTNLLLLLDSVIARIIIVIILLYLISIGPTAGIMGLVAIASIYLERNRRKVNVVAKKLDSMERPKYATVKEATSPQTTVPVNDFDTPVKKEFDYMPNQTCDSPVLLKQFKNSKNDPGMFEPVAESIDQKVVLNSSYPLHGINKLYEDLGFGHIGLD